MNCKQCSWYVTRELTPHEVRYLKQHKGTMIDHRICTLGGCDGSMFLNKDREGEQDG